MKISVDEIKGLMDKMAQNDLGALCIENEGFKLKIEAKKEKVQVVSAAETVVAATPMTIPATTEMPVAEVAPAKQKASGNIVKSPIVGTFYASPSPDKDAFVKVGQSVKKGDVLFIIESMKLMNEVQSEFDGTVLEIIAENAQSVEFDQEIMIIG